MATRAPEPGDVFVRGVSSAMRLVWREPETLDAFRESVRDARPSYSVVLLVLPLYFAATFAVPGLVADLGRLGAPKIDPAILAAFTTIAFIAAFAIYPQLVRPFVHDMKEKTRLPGYIAAQNFAAIPTALAVCGPILLFGVGLLTAQVAAAAAIASAVLSVELRYFLTTHVLGAEPGLAGVLVGLDIGLQAVLVQIAIAATIVLR
jgi:hypothetical protein